MMTHRHHAQHVLAAAAMIGALTALPGCTAGGSADRIGNGGFLAAFNAGVLPAEDFSDVPERRQPRAVPVEAAHEVMFAGSAADLNPADAARLDAFLDRTGVGRGDRVRVVAGRAASDGLAHRRREAVTAHLSGRGIVPRPPGGAPRRTAPPPGSVVVVVRRHVVRLPACPDWTGRPGRNFNNTVSSNWGCATAVNFGMMVADPADLGSGRDPGPTDGTYGALSIQRYHKGETTPLEPEDVGVTQSQQKSGSPN